LELVLTAYWWARGHGFESHPLHCRLCPWASCSRTPVSVTKQYHLGWWCSNLGRHRTGHASQTVLFIHQLAQRDEHPV